MPAHIGMTGKIEAYVAQHPGCLRSELLAALGLDKRNALPTYCVRIGAIFLAGPRGSQRYYPTLDEAHQADATIRAEVKARRKRLRSESHRKLNLRRRARRLAAGGKVVNTRPGQCLQLDAGTTISPDVPMKIARKVPARWESIVVPAAISSAEARPWAHACAAQMGGRL